MRYIFFRYLLVLIFVNFISICFGQDHMSAFGSGENSFYHLKGTVYKLPNETSRLPNDLSPYKKIAAVFTDSLNIPKQSYTNGFPGVENVFEFFAVDFRGYLFIQEAGNYYFSLGCDDGARLTINGKRIIDMSSVGGMRFGRGEYYFLKKGFYPIQVEYFQGPKPWIGLILEVSKTKSNYSILKLSDFLPIELRETNDGVELSFEGVGLFDINSFSLNSEAKFMLKELTSFVNSTKKYKSVLIEGHTDNVGDSIFNKNLGNSRALAVKYYLKSINFPLPINHISYGESVPLVLNNSEENRARNRRIEMKLMK